MKRTLLLTALLALLGMHANAQGPLKKIVPKFTVGIKAGANFQTLASKNWESSYKPGIVGGVFLGVFKNKWGVQAEGLVKSARFDAKTSGYIKTIGLDVPVLLEYKMFWRVWAQAGPQFSTVIYAKDNTDKDVKNYFKSSDISGVLGVEVKLPFHFNVGARYILGFADVNNRQIPAVTDAWRNRYAQVYLGFRFL